MAPEDVKIELLQRQGGRGAKLVGQQEQEVRSDGHQRDPGRPDGERRPAVTASPRSSGGLADDGVVLAVDGFAGTIDSGREGNTRKIRR